MHILSLLMSSLRLLYWTGGCRVVSKTEDSLAVAAQLLGCEKDDLKRSLVSRAMQATKGGRSGTVIQYVSTMLLYS